jgi:hypothetical protein
MVIQTSQIGNNLLILIILGFIGFVIWRKINGKTFDMSFLKNNKISKGKML